MLHAPRSQTNVETGKKNGQPALLPERELYPSSLAAAGQQSIMSTSRWLPAHAATDQRRTHLSTLQRAYGNQAALRVLNRSTPKTGPSQPVIQAKLAISQPGDVYEQEADRVAEHVIRMPEPTIQRTCAACANGGPCRKCEGGKKSIIQ